MAITGGSAVGLTGLGVTGASTLVGRVSIGANVIGYAAKAEIEYNKFADYGLVFKHLAGSDAGGNHSLLFLNAAAAIVGSIATTGTATAYNTTSDGRLKEQVEPLVGALDTIRALRPVQFRWKGDGSLGHGLIAQEVQEVVPGVVSHTETLGIDYGKLVPWLVSAVKELTQQVEMLQAQLAAVGA